MSVLFYYKCSIFAEVLVSGNTNNKIIILKDLEDKLILKLGTFYGDYGLNSRDEIILKTRGNPKNN